MAQQLTPALKVAIEESVGTTMISIPLELQMACPTTTNFDDFPMKPIGSTGTTHFTLAMSRATPVINLNWLDALPAALTKLQDGKLIEAGPVLGISADVPILDYQLALIPISETECTIYKLVSFLSRLHRSRIEAAIGPEVFVADMNKVPSTNRLHPILQKLFESLGGHQIRCKKVQPNIAGRAAKKVMMADEQELGFAFIREFGPRSNNQNQFVEWTQKHVSSNDSPIYGWDKGMVKESLRNYAAGEATAPDLTYAEFPLTLVDFKDWVIRDIVIPCLTVSAEKGIILHGLSGVGKTPLATAIGLAISAHYLNEAEREINPAIRAAQHIDNFRAESGSKFKPVLYDDGNLTFDSAAVLKGYLDASINIILWARWGGVKLVKQQARILCNNPINREADRADLPFFQATVPHKTFVDLTKDAFTERLNEEDHMAILKRCIYVVFGPNHMYLRQPGADAVPVKVLHYPDVHDGRPDLVRESSKAKIAKWRAGDHTTAPDHAHNLDWSIKLVRAAIGGEEITEFAPSMPPPAVQIKREINHPRFKRSLSKSQSTDPIDLTSPPKKQSKQKDETLSQLIQQELDELEHEAMDRDDEHMTMEELFESVRPPTTTASSSSNAPMPIMYPAIDLDEDSD